MNFHYTGTQLQGERNFPIEVKDNTHTACLRTWKGLCAHSDL